MRFEKWNQLIGVTWNALDGTEGRSVRLYLEGQTGANMSDQECRNEDAR
jgi:hypothetical protein